MLSPSHPTASSGQPTERTWLGIIGIGEDGVEGLGTLARSWIEKSEVVFGSRRQLELARPLVRGEARRWPSPFDRTLTQVVAERGRRVTVLASGDPFHYGIGPLIAAKTQAFERFVVPGVSSFSLAAARLGWALAHVHCVSAHGRSLDAIDAALGPEARLLILTSDETTPGAIAALARERGYAASDVYVLERLGGPHERIRTASAGAFDLADIHPLQVVALECRATAGPESGAEPGVGSPAAHATESASILLAPLEDACFEHDGQITKSELRGLALRRLGPRVGAHLWDVGAGSGSIGIEWLRLHPSLSADAIEARADRIERILRNAQQLGAARLGVVHGRAPQALENLQRPDAVFVGGGAEAGAIEFALNALPSGGRLVAHAVTFETEARLRELQQRFGGELIQVALSRAEALGSFTGWKPARPIVQWSHTRS